MKTSLKFSILLLVFCMPVFSTTYYINSNTGSNQNDGLAAETPFLDFWKLDHIRIHPGDSILFAANSSYSGYFNVKYPGKAGEPVVISNYGKGERPDFSNPGEWYAIGLVAEHLIIENLQVHTTHTAGIQIDSSNCVVKNCDIYNTGFGIAIYNKHNKIFENTIHDLHIIRNTPGGNDDYGAVGIEIECGANEIAYNSFINCIDTSYDYGVDGGAIELFGDIDSIYVHHNYAENCDGFFEVGGGTVKNIEIYYNLLLKNGEIGGFHFKGDFGAVVENFNIVNNTVYDISRDQYEVLWFNGNEYANEVKLMNNVIVYDGFQRFSGEKGFWHNYNIYFSPSNEPLGIQMNENEMFAKPGFISPETNNFELSSGSPSIDNGKMHSYQFDYLGNPISGHPDLGAFEYQPLLHSTFQHGPSTMVYPNPSSGIFYLKGTKEAWKVHGLKGALLLEGNGPKIDMTGFQPGLYLLKTDIQCLQMMLTY